MSRYDDLHDESWRRYPPDDQEGPRRGGCFWGCLIVLVLIVLLILGVVGFFFWIAHNISSGMTQDPQEIMQRLRDRFPEAKLPEGFEPRAALKMTAILQMDLLVFGMAEAQVDESGEVHAGDALMLFSFKVPGVDEVEMEEALEAGGRGGKLLEKRQRTFKAGEYEFDGWIQKVQRRGADGQASVHHQLLVPLGNNTVLILQSDREAPEEAALLQFLESIAKDCPAARKPPP